MAALELIGFVVLAVIAVAGSVVWFLRDVHRIVAPDTFDGDAIDHRFGADSAEAARAKTKRFGRGAHWRDALTAIVGISGLALLYWTWFK